MKLQTIHIICVYSGIFMALIGHKINPKFTAFGFWFGLMLVRTWL